MVKPLNISILDDYSTNCLIMIFRANQNIKMLIINTLKANSFLSLNKARKNFLLIVFCNFLSIKGKINFLQFERFSSYSEQTYRNQFEVPFDFIAFNGELIKQVVSSEKIIALDPSYIPKSGKSTYGRGRYWSGVAKSTKWGLDICGFAVVDIKQNTAFHLNAWQTPTSSELEKKEMTLLTYYGSLVEDNATKFKEFSNYIVADAYFSKKPFVDIVLGAGLHVISRLRDDSVLYYKYTGERTGKRGAPKKVDGKVNVKDIDMDRFSLDFSSNEMNVYSAIVYSKAFKMDIKLAIAIFLKDGKEVARKLYFSTDLKLEGLKIVSYYRARFQIEFLYRDAKQYTGLTNCQARSKNKLDFHFNAALSSVNLAKIDWISSRNKEQKTFSMANYKTLFYNALMIERFMCVFAINPNSTKNQNIVKKLLEYGKIAA